MNKLVASIIGFILVLPVVSQQCTSSGILTGKVGKCSDLNDSDCCIAGRRYRTYTCSPPVTRRTYAILTINGFDKNEDGGGAASCDGKYHKNTEMIVAMSTGWFDNKSRCGKYILITANNRTVRAKVVDECDSRAGCDAIHSYQPPCRNDIIDASAAIWRQLRISRTASDYGYKRITWTDSTKN